MKETFSLNFGTVLGIPSSIQMIILPRNLRIILTLGHDSGVMLYEGIPLVVQSYTVS